MCGLTSSFCQEQKERKSLSGNSCYWKRVSKLVPQYVDLFKAFGQHWKVRLRLVPMHMSFRILSTRWWWQTLAVLSKQTRRHAQRHFIVSKGKRKENTHQFHQLLEKRNQLQKFTVVSVHEPALDGDPV